MAFDEEYFEIDRHNVDMLILYARNAEKKGLTPATPEQIDIFSKMVTECGISIDKTEMDRDLLRLEKVFSQDVAADLIGYVNRRGGLL